MTVNDTLKSDLSRVLGSRSGKTTAGAALSSIRELVLWGQQAKKPEEHPLFWVAASIDNWTVSGFEHVLGQLGVSRISCHKDPIGQSAKIMQMLTKKESASKIALGVLSHWEEVIEGTFALPVRDRVIKPHQVLRDIVSEHKGQAKYRTYLRLPALFTGTCTCCNTHRMLQIVQMLTTIPAVEKVESVLVDKLSTMIDGRGNEFGIQSSFVIDLAKDDRNAALMFLLNGGASQAVVVPILTKRWDGGKTSYDVKFACANCLDNLENPASLISSAHATKFTTDLFYKLTRDIGVPGALALRKIGKMVDYSKDKNLGRAHLNTALDFDKRGDKTRSLHGSNRLGGDTKKEKIEEDALCRELISAGMQQYVQKQRSKSNLLKLSADGRKLGVSAIKAKLRVSVAEDAPVEDFTNLFGDSSE